MKIIAIDNFSREHVSDLLVAENIQNTEFAQTMCEALNKKFCNHDHAPRFFEVKPDAHVLYVFEP